VGATSDRGRALAMSAALAVATVAAYAPTFRNGFTSFDDDVYVTKNAEVLAGLTWRGAAWAFTTGHGSNWHPLTWLTHMLDVELFGVSAAGHHAVSLVLHVASALLLLRFLLRTTGSLAPSAFVAAVFALHPQHVESVAWAAERKDVLCALFWILGLSAYVRWVERPTSARYALVLALFAAGLLAKPMIVTFPFTLLLLDLWPLARIDGTTFRSRVVEKIPFLALSAVSCAVTLAVQRAGGAVASAEAIPLPLRLGHAVVAYATYLSKAFWPADLAAYYPHPFADHPIALVAGCVALLAALTFGAASARKRAPWLLVGWLWFLGTLVPVIGLVQVGSQAIADRYTYVPMIGLAIAVGFACADLVRRVPSSRIVVTGVLAASLLAGSALTRRQVAYWKDDASLLPIARGKLREGHAVHATLGRAYLRDARYTEAIDELREAVRLEPGFAEGHNDLGMALEAVGRKDEALLEYRAALRSNPALFEAHHNLAGVLADGKQLDEAIEQYERALAIRPDSVETHFDLATVLLARGRKEEAMAELRRTLELAPEHAHAREALDALR
jgi:protein O-mannosyl-transferase